MEKSNSDQLNRLLNEAMPKISRHISKHGEYSDYMRLVKSLLTIWGRYEHSIAIQEMMENKGSVEEASIGNLRENDADSLNDYTDIKKCISEL